jgi:hypothetical protein
MQLAGPTDTRGVLQFADKAADAPVLHFRGPWQITLYSRPHLRIGRDTEMILAVGSPGLGNGTTTFVGYDDLIPDGANPKAEVTFPGGKPGDPPIRELYELKQRC